MNANNVIHLPSSQEVEQARDSSRTLAKYLPNGRIRLKVMSEDKGEGDDLILPSYAMELIQNVLTEMAKGNAITVLPIHAELSTQEVANLLNVSRPYVVSLLEKGEIPFHKVGSHRRVLAKDVIAYKEKTETERLQALDELTELSQELGMGYE